MAGGVNWSAEADIVVDLGLDLVQPTLGEDHISVIGPELDTP
ncbi:hypothetical protein [Actinocorallia lasiicapitis]